MKFLKSIIFLTTVSLMSILFAKIFIPPTNIDISVVDTLRENLNPSNVSAVTFIAFIVLIMGLFIPVMLSYVNKNTGVIKNVEPKDDSYYISLVNSEVDKIRAEISSFNDRVNAEGSSVELSESERNEIIREAKKRIIGNTLLIANDSLKNDISNFKLQVNLHRHCKEMIYRLDSEISRLNVRGGVNLTFGTALALAGIAFLGYVIYTSPPIQDKASFFINLIPKFSFVFLIEIFAYFFLRLYKNGFEDVKYFQNEMTNVESKALAIKVMSNLKSEELVKEVVDKLMSTERNFILTKGQTTVSLEREKIKITEEGRILNIIGDIFKIKFK